MVTKILTIIGISFISLFTFACSDSFSNPESSAVKCYESIYAGDIDTAMAHIYFPQGTTVDDYQHYRVTLIKTMQVQQEDAENHKGIKSIKSLRALDGYESEGHKTKAVTIQVVFNNHQERAYKVSVYNVDDKWLVRM